jgi:uncharacterized integral membrane protein
VEDRPQAADSGRNLARYIPAGIIIVVLLVFAFQNRKTVNIDYIFFDRDSRLIYVIIGWSFLGFVAGWLIGRRRLRHRD